MIYSNKLGTCIDELPVKFWSREIESERAKFVILSFEGLLGDYYCKNLIDAR